MNNTITLDLRVSCNIFWKYQLMLKVNCDEQQAELILQRFDSDEDGRLGFWELMNMFMPRN
jgi:Ca2+-binding EF-hand superfamily protein